jgi:phenylacetic acid degradation operon negative regulatory protein
MKASNDEFLNLLLWTADQLAHPTFRNLTESYESWAYRNGRFFCRLNSLEKRQLVERDPAAPDERVYRLTAQGRLCALGGRDPQACWRRSWDGLWRLVLFDIPVKENTRRKRLCRYLRQHGFGYLQDSLWISPDPLDEQEKVFAGSRIDVESLIFFQANPCAGESNEEIVAGAWNFPSINRNYAQHMKILNERPTGELSQDASARELLLWASMEREAWLKAVTSDPLLPERILPPDYLGQQAWHRRIEVFREAGRQLSTFTI